jgi:SAM-dependent methyltransferase
MFKNAQEAHAHSLETLNQLYEYDDFMASIKTVVDLGCGPAGLDLEWWATATMRDERSTPLGIQCHGVDTIQTTATARKYNNIQFHCQDFEGTIDTPPEKYDILWCHDAFQYAINPIQTLSNWRKISSPGAMLYIAVPQTTNIRHKDLDFTQQDGCYYHYTIVSLIHMLALTGWDCRAGFFKKTPTDPWLHAVVYKSNQEPRDPKTTRWYDLVDTGLLPVTADKSIQAKGFLDQRDLVLPWLDKNLIWLGQQ